MTSISAAWILGGRHDRRTRAVLVVTLAALVFGLALQSARACMSAWNPGSPIEEVAVHAHAGDLDDGHCHHDGTGALDACFVHCEQDGQAARANPETGADDLRLALFDGGSAYRRWQAPHAAREPVAKLPRLDPPAYLLLHRLNR
jgi:hypothetical protein